MACAVTQEEEPKRPESIIEAAERVLSRPVKASYRLSVLRRAGEEAPLDWQLREYQAALWIQPTNPYIRDKVAETLTALGRMEEALKEIAQSVAHSPSLRMHEYLSKESLPELSEEEQQAVERGFKQALAWSYPEALNGLAEFYQKLERYADVAALYEQAAATESDNQKKITLRMDSGLAYLRAERATDQRSEVRSQKSDNGTDAKRQAQRASLVRSEESGVRSDGRNAERDNAINATNARDAERNNADSQRSAVSDQRSNEETTNARNATNAINAKNEAWPIQNPKSKIQNPETPHGVAAERLFRAAIAVNPSDPKPYHQLLTAVFATRKDLDGAKELVGEGLKNGAPALPLYLSFAEAAHKAGNPDESEAALDLAKTEVQKRIRNGESSHTLYMALADGARRAGDRDEESAALLKALERQPRSPVTLMRLANVYLEKRNFDRAAMYLNRVAGITPNSADLFYRIAQAEEARYRFAAAGRAYARAVELEPNNEGYRERYEAFRERVAANASERDQQSAKR
jgi:predicted Zn-dependent protease